MRLKKPLLSGLLSLSLLLNLLTPALAYNSQGSNTDLDNLEGIDKAQDNVSTDYWKDLTDQDTADTHVYATRSSTFTALVPKTIILSGIDGHAQYVVGVKGDVFTQDTVTIAPESYELTLQKVGDPGSTVSASITQNTTTVTGADIKDNVYSTMEGSIQAEGLKAGSWKSTITFNIQINETNQTYHYHDLTHIDAAEGTDASPGHSEYWYCEECDKYYGDVNGSSEISQYDTYVDTIPFTVRADNRGKVNYSETEENLVIPAVFKDKDDGNWYKVTAIDEMAFYQATGLKTVQIPETVTSIGRGAFLLCNNLESVNIPKGVTVLESRVFSSMALTETEINIPDNITTIGDMVFDGNLTAIHSIKIPASVTSINPAAFLNVPGLRSIEVSPDNPNYSSVDGVLFNKDQTVLIRYPQAKTNEPYTVPDTVKEIGTLAFRNCGSVEVRVPDTVTVIGDNAFQASHVTVYYCGSAEGSPWGANSDQVKHSALVHVAASEATEEHPAMIEHWICEGCGEVFSDADAMHKISKYEVYTGLQSFSVTSKNKAEIGYTSTTTDLVIPDIFKGTDGSWNMVTEIGAQAFSSSRKLESVIIPDTVTSIGDRAFAYCSSLQSVTIPDSILDISVRSSVTLGAFYRAAPKEVNIYKSLYTIDVVNDTVFSVFNIGSIKSINVDPKSLNYISIDGALFNKDKTKLIAFPNSEDCDSITIPASTTYLGTDIFKNVNALKSINVDANNPNYSSVDGILFNKDQTILIRCPQGKTEATITIPMRVTTISDSAFYQCSNLTSITVPDSVTTIGESAFNGCTGLTSIEIPDSVTFIGSSAFCKAGLISITIPDSITTINKEVFSWCTGLTSVNIPDSITTIEGSAFYHCPSLTSVIVPDSVTSIGSSAFHNVPKVIYDGTATGSPWSALRVEKSDGTVIYSAT